MAWLFGNRHSKSTAATAVATKEREGKRRFFWLGERRHLANAPYVLPSDEREISRLDFQHYMLRYALRGNYASPIQHPTSILDVGSGTGRWAMEIAQLFPYANVIGTDLVEPKTESVNASLGNGLERRPENHAFVQANVMEGLPFADNSFDYVHMRLLLFAIPHTSWPAVTRELLRVTRPGGWVESVETGPQQDGGRAMDKIVAWITEASMRRGVDPLLGPRVAQFFADAGLRNMVTRELRLPVGAYGGRLGTMAAADVFGVISGVKPMVVAQGITDAASYDAAMAQAREDLDRVRCTLPFYIAFGQKG
jgi:ubiquinone/menaquinone biosynthesis C-methylase UbiE